jgi:hypothetical protein
MPIERFDDLGLPPVVTYPRDAVLTKRQVAAALQCHEDVVAKMDLPSFGVGERERFIWGIVLDVLSERALPSAGAGASTKRIRRTG